MANEMGEGAAMTNDNREQPPSKRDKQLHAHAERIIATLEFHGVLMNGHKISATGIVYRHLKAMEAAQ